MGGRVEQRPYRQSAKSGVVWDVSVHLEVSRVGSGVRRHQAPETLQRHAPENCGYKGAEDEARSIQPADSWESVQDHLHHDAHA